MFKLKEVTKTYDVRAHFRPKINTNTNNNKVSKELAKF